MKFALLLSLCAVSAFGFEKIALLDSYDFARTFDVETTTGNVQVLEHVLETGCDTVLWRNCTGATMRYASAEEPPVRTECPVEKLRIPESRRVFGWMRLDRPEVDVFRLAMSEIGRRGLAKGVHWPFEEAHGAHFTYGQWNLEHPQYWCVTKAGMPIGARASLSHPEVVAHKLRLVDELLERGADIVYVDMFRNGGWTPAWEYVGPMKDAWARTYPGEPLPDYTDPRWSALAMAFQHAYFRALRRHLDASGRKVRLLLGINQAGRPVDRDYDRIHRGVDWRALAADGTVDGLIVMCVARETLDAPDVWRETERVYRGVVAEKGRAKVYFPVSMYDYAKTGIPSYRRRTGLSSAAAAQRLLELAARCGGDGISMECVDYDNYDAVTRAVIRAFRP